MIQNVNVTAGILVSAALACGPGLDSIGGWFPVSNVRSGQTFEQYHRRVLVHRPREFVVTAFCGNAKGGIVSLLDHADRSLRAMPRGEPFMSAKCGFRRVTMAVSGRG